MLKNLSTFLWCFTCPVVVSAQELPIVNIRLSQGDATLIQGPPDVSGQRVNVFYVKS